MGMAPASNYQRYLQRMFEQKVVTRKASQSQPAPQEATNTNTPAPTQKTKGNGFNSVG